MTAGRVKRKGVSSRLQTLRPQRPSVAIPVENLDPVGAPPAEYEQMSAERIDSDDLLGQHAQSVEAAPHVAGRGAEIDADGGR